MNLPYYLSLTELNIYQLPLPAPRKDRAEPTRVEAAANVICVDDWGDESEAPPKVATPGKKSPPSALDRRTGRPSRDWAPVLAEFDRLLFEYGAAAPSLEAFAKAIGVGPRTLRYARARAASKT